MDMSKVKGQPIWQPQVLGRMKLDESRFMYAGDSAIDMPADVPNLVDTMVVLDGAPFVIRGITPNLPAKAITKDEVIALLVLAL